MIEKKWGIRYSRAHVSRILKSLGVQVAMRGSTSLPQLTSA
jgi:transposase